MSEDKDINEELKEPLTTEYIEPKIITGKGMHVEFSTVSIPNIWNETEELKEADDAMRYRDYKADNRRPY